MVTMSVTIANEYWLVDNSKTIVVLFCNTLKDCVSVVHLPICPAVSYSSTLAIRLFQG
jgi:hypothetical protein